MCENPALLLFGAFITPVSSAHILVFREALLCLKPSLYRECLTAVLLGPSVLQDADEGPEKWEKLCASSGEHISIHSQRTWRMSKIPVPSPLSGPHSPKHHWGCAPGASLC